MQLIDTDSATWRAIAVYLEDRLADLREKNDDLALDATATAAIRAEIKAIKDLQALPAQLGVPAFGGGSVYLG